MSVQIHQHLSQQLEKESVLSPPKIESLLLNIPTGLELKISINNPYFKIFTPTLPKQFLCCFGGLSDHHRACPCSLSPEHVTRCSAGKTDQGIYQDATFPTLGQLGEGRRRSRECLWLLIKLLQRCSVLGQDSPACTCHHSPSLFYGMI